MQMFLLLLALLVLSACSGSISGSFGTDGPGSPGDGDGIGDGDGDDPDDPNNTGDGDGDGDGDDPNAPASCGEAASTKVLVRRLSGVEYNRTVGDLFPSFQIPQQSLVTDLAVHGFENNAASLNPAPVLIEQYADAAILIAELVGNNMGAFLPCAAITPDAACGREMIEDFGRRALRRPLTTEEADRYGAFFEQQMTAISFRGALELTVQAFLQAPQFLYRIELGVPEDGEEILALDDHEMASRLSYFLWQSMPDDVLFDAAEAGELSTPEGVAEQARRMLDDPRAAETVIDFHRQWLDFDRVMEENKDPVLYPTWTDTLRNAMREESDRFVEHLYQSDANLLQELLTSRTTFANPILAEFYGVPAPTEEWGMTTLPEGERSGYLTRGNFLAAYAHSTNGSPPLRGVAIMDRWLCEPPPPPPPTADTSPPMAVQGAAPRTNRELFEERTSPDACTGCHTTINGLGFPFEGYDAAGAFRTQDNGIDVDATGEIRGTDDINGEIDDALHLSEQLASSGQVRDCMVRNWFRFAFAREPGRADSCALEDFSTALADGEGNVKDLIVAIASSHDFMHRPSGEE
jgi:hypothetical protein